MSKLQKIVFFGFLLAIATLVYMEATKPQPINWFPSYNHDDKIPLGTYVLFDLMENTFQDKITEINRPPFEVLKDSSFNGTYFFVNDYISFEKAEADAILDWAELGNTVFISANTHNHKFLDTLGIEAQTAVLIDRIGTQPMLNLVNDKLKSEKPYLIDRDLIVRYFEEIDTLAQTVLGVTQPYRDTLMITKPQVNFLKAPFGDGAIYLHNQPEIFSNYFLLKEDNFQHTENVLSYINNNSQVYWDRYYKSGKPMNVSPLYILLNNKYLKWAYYFVLIGAVLFVFFEGKRKQRSVAIVKPLDNKTYEYTQTISGMYLDKKQYHEVAQKQIILFFEFIRTRLRVPTENYNSRFLKAVAARSGNDLETTQNLFTFIEKVQNQQDTSEQELIKLNREITEYKKKLDGTI